MLPSKADIDRRNKWICDRISAALRMTFKASELDDKQLCERLGCTKKKLTQWRSGEPPSLRRTDAILKRIGEKRDVWALAKIALPDQHKNRKPII